MIIIYFKCHTMDSYFISAVILYEDILGKSLWHKTAQTENHKPHLEDKPFPVKKYFCMGFKVETTKKIMW